MLMTQEEQALAIGFFARGDAKERQNRAQIDDDAKEDEAQIEMHNDSYNEKRLPNLDRLHEDIAQRDEAGQVSDGEEDAEPQNEVHSDREADFQNFEPDHDENAERDQVQVDNDDVVEADQGQVQVGFIAEAIVRPEVEYILGKENDEEEAKIEDDYGEESVA